jgi:hypothetical protein
MALIPNPLNKFSSYSCIWTLDVATKEEINSGNFSKKQGKIARSGGIANTYGEIITLEEQNRGIKGEYFIDNVSIQAVVSPNPHSGVTKSTLIGFEITEPYSIGLFLETLQLAALVEANETNYLSAYFVLTCEFIGYDSDGNISTLTDEKRVIVMKLTNITFSVNAGGSVYRVEGVAVNEIPLSDPIQRIKTQISLRGDTIGNILSNFGNIAPRDPRSRGDTGQSTHRSLVAVLNEHEESIRLRASAETANQYEILFVEHPATPDIPSNIDTKRLITSFEDLTIQDVELDQRHYDTETNIYSRGNLTINFNDGIFQFKKDTKIEKIIEEIILSSEWSDDLINQKPDSNGYINWFRIFTKVTVLEGKNAENDTALKYTYMVYPYKVHASTVSHRFKNINYNSLLTNAVKGYSYIYTGENSDIIDFDIEIKYAWLQKLSDLVDENASSRNDPGSLLVNPPETTTHKGAGGFEARAGEAVPIVVGGVRPEAVAAGMPEARASVYRDPTFETVHGGSPINTQRVMIARMYNNAILNSNADLLLVKLTIWGDPYFLSNTYASPPDRYFITQNKYIDDWRSEVDVLLKFGTVVDYQNNLLLPTNARQFTGVYKVVGLTSRFENNVFKQELDLVRRPVQDMVTIANVENTINVLQNGVSTAIIPANSGAMAGPSIELFLTQAEKTEQLFSAFSQLNLRDVASSLNINTGELIGKLTGLTSVFDTAKQLASSFNNLKSLSDISSIKNINLQNLEQQLNQLISAQDLFKQAFDNLKMDTIVNTLNLNLAGAVQDITGQIQGQIQNTVGQVQGLVTQVQNIPGQIQNTIGQLQAFPQDLASSLSNGLTITVNGPIGSKTAVDFGSAFSPIFSFAADAQSLITNFKSVTNNLTSSINSLTSTVNNIKTTASSIESSFKSIGSNLPRL